jgi:serine/threonine-protein kinase HipA
MSFIDRYFESKGYSVKDITLLDRLSFIGDRGMGAIEYRPKEGENVLKVQQNVLVAKNIFENMQDIFSKKQESYLVEELMEVLYGASPLGGGRPKLLISFNEMTKQIRTNDKTLQQGFVRSIIKFDEAYYENESIEFTKFEYLYMNMAKDCGIDISKIFLLEELGLHHLIVKRFDRDENDQKIHIATASALLHKDINIPKVMSYEELFILTNRICKKQSSVEQLFKRMVFNTLSFNVDDHAKNFSFMMGKEGNWELTPAYDMTYSYGMVKEHLTTLGGKGRDFALADYLAIAQKNLIAKERAIAMINQVVAVMETLEKRAEVIGISLENMRGCLENVNLQLNLIDL